MEIYIRNNWSLVPIFLVRTIIICHRPLFLIIGYRPCFLGRLSLTLSVTKLERLRSCHLSNTNDYHLSLTPFILETIGFWYLFLRGMIHLLVNFAYEWKAILETIGLWYLFFHARAP